MCPVLDLSLCALWHIPHHLCLKLYLCLLCAVASLIHVQGNKKATVQEILQGEPIIPPTVSEEARNFIQWSLTKDPRRRPSVADLMEHTWVTENMSQPVSRKGIQRAGGLRHTFSFIPKSQLSRT